LESLALHVLMKPLQKRLNLGLLTCSLHPGGQILLDPGNFIVETFGEIRGQAVLCVRRSGGLFLQCFAF